MDVKNQNVADREVIFTRVFEVPARVLFKACSTAEHLKQWFGPRNYPLTLCEVDFRIGGKYRFAMTGPDGKQMTPFGGEYLEIEQDKKISFSNRFELPDAETMVITYLFNEKQGKTTLTHQTVFGSVKMKNEHMLRGYEQGVGESLDLLRECVASL